MGIEKELEIKKLKELYGQDFFSNLRKNYEELKYSSDKQVLAWMEKRDAKLDEMEQEDFDENSEWKEPSNEEKEKEKARQELIKRGMDPDEELPF